MLDPAPPGSSSETPAPRARSVDARSGDGGFNAVIDLLTDQERTVATAVAVGDGQLDQAALARVTQFGELGVVGALDVLAWVELVRWTPDGRMIAAHALIRHALLDGAPPDLVRELHERIARTLDDLNAPPALVAAHIEESGEPGPLALVGLARALAACRTACELGDIDAARAAMERAERLADRLTGPSPGPGGLI